jgi:hypothetical protein
MVLASNLELTSHLLRAADASLMQQLASGTAASAATTDNAAVVAANRRRTSRYESDAAVTKAECDADVARVTKRMHSDSQVDVANAFTPVTLAFRHVGYRYIIMTYHIIIISFYCYMYMLSYIYCNMHTTTAHASM